MSSVRIRYKDFIVGYLTWDQAAQRSVLELDESYMESPLDLAPLTIDKRLRIHQIHDPQNVFNGLPPLLADSLPDHFGNRVFQEWLIKNKYSISDLNPVDRLMYIASRGMGGLCYEPARDVPDRLHTIDLKALASVSEQIIQGKYDYSDFLANEQALQHILRIGSSVGGAQAKVLVALDEETGELKAGDVLHNDPSYRYYIVKLAHDTGTPWGQEKILVEYAYHLMAKAAGIETAEMRLYEDQGARHLMIERFDRPAGQRMHMQTLMALSGRHDRRIPFSYEDCFRIMTALRMPHSDLKRLYRQLVFNVVSRNMDDHSKNISFLMDDKGQWRLSPAYDLTYPFDPYLPSLQAHKMSINGKVKDISEEDLLITGKKVGIRARKRIIAQTREAIAAFEDLARAEGVSERSIGLLNSALSY